MFSRGATRAEVARGLRVSWQTSHAWFKAWNSGGRTALKSKGKPGPAPMFNDAHRARLAGLLAQGPQAHGYEPVPQPYEWMRRFEAKREEASRKKGAIDLVLVGDSITQGLEGQAALVERHLGGKTVLNLGINADRTENILWRLRNGALDGLSPKVAVVMAGTNNTGHRQDPPEVTAQGIGLVVGEIRARCPGTKILLFSIFPRGASPDDPLRKLNAQVNALLPGLADGKNIFHRDINGAFLDAQGNLPTETMPDLLHPNARGYEIWLSAMAPEIEKISAPLTSVLAPPCQAAALRRAHETP